MGGGALIQLNEYRSPRAIILWLLHSLHKELENKVEKLLVGGHTAEEKHLTSPNVQSSYICTYHICLLFKNNGGA